MGSQQIIGLLISVFITGFGASSVYAQDPPPVNNSSNINNGYGANNYNIQQFCLNYQQQKQNALLKASRVCNSLGYGGSSVSNAPPSADTLTKCLNQSESCGVQALSATSGGGNGLCQQYLQEQKASDVKSDYKDAKTERDSANDKVAQLQKDINDLQEKNQQDDQTQEAKVTQAQTDLQNFMTDNQTAIDSLLSQTNDTVESLNEDLGSQQSQLKQDQQTAAVQSNNQYQSDLQTIDNKCAQDAYAAAVGNKATNDAKAASSGGQNLGSLAMLIANNLSGQNARSVQQQRISYQSCETRPDTVQAKNKARQDMVDRANKLVQEIDNVNVKIQGDLNKVNNALKSEAAQHSTLEQKLAAKTAQTQATIQAAKNAINQANALYQQRLAQLQQQLAVAQNDQTVTNNEYQQLLAQKQYYQAMGISTSQSSIDSLQSKMDKITDPVMQGLAYPSDDDDDPTQAYCTANLGSGAKGSGAAK